MLIGLVNLLRLFYPCICSWQRGPERLPCFYEQIPILYLTERYSGDARAIFLEFARDIYTEFNIYTAFFPRLAPASKSGTETVSMKIYFFKEEDFYLKFQELETLYKKEVTPWLSPKWGPYAIKEANFLDYPECCAKWFK
jgi:hypothetical protein